MLNYVEWQITRTQAKNICQMPILYPLGLILIGALEINNLQKNDWVLLNVLFFHIQFTRFNMLSEGGGDCFH
jgi:hypothetical protein